MSPGVRYGNGPIRTDMWEGALDDHDRMVMKLAPEHRELYAAHLAGNRKLLARMQKLASDPKKVVKAVDRALTSKHPKRRYLLDNLSRAQKGLVAATPTAINDALFSAVSTSR